MKTEMAYAPLRSIQHKDVFGNAICTFFGKDIEEELD